MEGQTLSFQTKFDFGKYFRGFSLVFGILNGIFIYESIRYGHTVPLLVWLIYLFFGTAAEAFFFTELLIGWITDPLEKKMNIKLDTNKLVINDHSIRLNEIEKIEEYKIGFKLKHYIFEPRSRLDIHTQKGDWTVKNNLTDYQIFISELVKRSGLISQNIKVKVPGLFSTQRDYKANMWK